MSVLTSELVRYEHFRDDRIMVLHFRYPTGVVIPETFNSWDWYGMRRAIIRNIPDPYQEERHSELVKLARYERQLQDEQMRQWINESTTWRTFCQWLGGLIYAGLLFGAVGGLGVVAYFGWRLARAVVG